MFTLKSPLKYFPISKGNYSVQYEEATNVFRIHETVKNINGLANIWMGYDQNNFWQATEFYIEIQKAYGTCITTGLGLGIIQSHLCLKNEVDKVIVYEKSKDMIEIFHEIIKFNNFDISKLEIRNEDAGTIKNQTCDCLFIDHCEYESMDELIKIVKDLSYNNTAQLVWYWPAGHHFIKFANRYNKPYNKDTYKLFKNYTGIKNLADLSDDLFQYINELERIYMEYVPGRMNLEVAAMISRKNMINQSKKFRK